MYLDMILIATALAAASGLPGCFAGREAAWGERVAAVMASLGAIIGLAGVTGGLMGGAEASVSLHLPLAGWNVALALDALSAFFLAPIFLIGGLGSIYGLGYWAQAEHPGNGRKLRLFWGFLMSGMAVLVLARNSIVFLMGWEVMALSAFFLITTDDQDDEVRQAGLIYLITTHVGTLFIIATFALLRVSNGSFDLVALTVDQAGLGMLTSIFFLALVGFGLKAGFMPLHFWLPSAHANAPSHVSAFLSGVLIKMGIYGLVRVAMLLPHPPVIWGVILLTLGAISGVLGVLFAIGQHDLKRLLAYHSVENIGIIVMGLGLAMVGRSIGRVDWQVLGMAGCLLHVWNHGLFKPLLFMGAGSVIHATGTREIDRLGGLAKSMPWTAGLFLVGAVAICGLPPLNGFISELFIYMGLFRTMGIGVEPMLSGAALAVPALAMIGALAVACFVKAFGAVFLGESRSAATSGAHESPMAMIWPMAVIAACCFFIGLAPFAFAPILDSVVSTWGSMKDDQTKLMTLIPLTAVGAIAAALIVIAGAAGLLLMMILKGKNVSRACTWDCGYAKPAARMQYTSSSMAQMLVGLFRWLLRPRVHPPAISGLFSAESNFSSHVDDVVLEEQIKPMARMGERLLGRIRGMQQGLTQQYVLYILVAVVVLLIWTMPIARIVTRMFAR